MNQIPNPQPMLGTRPPMMHRRRKNTGALVLLLILGLLLLGGIGYGIYYYVKLRNKNGSTTTPPSKITTPPSTNASSCTTTTDCSPTTYCMNGQCVPRKTNGDDCKAHGDCMPGMGCINGKCQGQQLSLDNLPDAVKHCDKDGESYIQWFLPTGSFTCIKNGAQDPDDWVCKNNHSIYVNSYDVQDTDDTYKLVKGNDGTDYKFRFRRAMTDKDSMNNPCATYEQFSQYTTY